MARLKKVIPSVEVSIFLGPSLNRCLCENDARPKTAPKIKYAAIKIVKVNSGNQLHT